MSVQDLTNTTEVSVLRMGFQGLRNIAVRQIGVGDDAVGKAAPIGEILQPSGFADRIARIIVGLHVNGLDQVLVAGVGEEIVEQVIAAQRTPVPPAAIMERFVLQPGIPVVRGVPQVMVRIDNRHRHYLRIVRPMGPSCSGKMR